jgi:hypothetical protein
MAAFLSGRKEHTCLKHVPNGHSCSTMGCWPRGARSSKAEIAARTYLQAHKNISIHMDRYLNDTFSCPLVCALSVLKNAESTGVWCLADNVRVGLCTFVLQESFELWYTSGKQCVRCADRQGRWGEGSWFLASEALPACCW